MNKTKFSFAFTSLILIIVLSSSSTKTSITRANNSKYDSSYKSIHIFVALCDNKYQGIVPVPVKIGNGQDPNNNLYWGCGYGIRSYFKKSTEWKFVKSTKIDDTILERIVFKHISKNYYLVADAYNGKEIKKCTEDFLLGCAGITKDTLHVNDKIIGINGNSTFLSYIGHDGLMDFELTKQFKNADGKIRKCVILACISKSYFAPHLKQTKADPVVWTTGLMCPEAYTVHDAISGYIAGESNEQIRTRAAKAYSTHQKKCSEKAARNLLVTGY